MRDADRSIQLQLNALANLALNRLRGQPGGVIEAHASDGVTELMMLVKPLGESGPLFAPVNPLEQILFGPLEKHILQTIGRQTLTAKKIATRIDAVGADGQPTTALKLTLSNLCQRTVLDNDDTRGYSVTPLVLSLVPRLFNSGTKEE